MNGSSKIGRATAATALAMGVISGSALARAQVGATPGATPSQGDQTEPAPGGAPTGNHGGYAPAQPEPRPRRNEPAPGSTTGAAEQLQKEPGEAMATAVVATATVQKIDRAGKKLTLLGPSGQSFDVKAGPDVDFDRLRVGDRVTATYYEEVAVAINRHPQAGPAVTMRSVQRGGVTARQATVTAKIVAVDTAEDTVTVKTADAKQHTLKVDDPQIAAQLRTIKPGENVDLTYTQAVAIDVEPSAEPAK
jgi:hypothetical protein